MFENLKKTWAKILEIREQPGVKENSTLLGVGILIISAMASLPLVASRFLNGIALALLIFGGGQHGLDLDEGGG